MRPWLGVLLASFSWLSVACSSGDDEAAPPTCALDVELPGMPQPRDEPACAVQLGSGSGISAGFLFIEPETISVDLDVHDVTEGELGTFPATVEVSFESSGAFRTPARSCSVELSEHRPVGEDMFRTYQTAGSGTCPEPAIASSGVAQGQLELGTFRFRAQALWTD